MANNMNKNKLWSDSLTKNSRSTYAEGLACNNFDKRTLYNIWRNDENTWWVLKKVAGTMACASYDSCKILYDRVRIVCIDSEGFMSCSCGKVQMYLMPCEHLCAIIEKKNLYVPSMFHIRWHKLFNYYHGNNYGMKLAEHSTATINHTVLWTRENCFRDSGSYKGVYVKDTLFFQQLPDFNSIKTDMDNLVPHLMTKIVNQTQRGQPVIKDSIPFDVLNSTFEITEIDDDASFQCVENDEIDNIGGFSQAECFLSQQREDNDNSAVKHGTERNTYYKEALPLFEEMGNSCPSKHMFDVMCEEMRSRHMIHIASRGINNQICSSKGISLFGENNTNKRSVKRYKFMHEK